LPGEILRHPMRSNRWQTSLMAHFLTKIRSEMATPEHPQSTHYPPNGYGLYDMAGNCWQWTADLYRPDAYANHTPEDPTGPTESFDPDEPGITKFVQRGGSFLCSADYCVRYRVAGRGKGARDTGASNVSFRCISLK